MRAQSGESIVETLAAVLVCSFAVLMLYTAVASAAHMNSIADQTAQQLRQDAIAVETQESTGDYREVAFSGFSEVYTVEYYKGGEDGYVSYRLL